MTKLYNTLIVIGCSDDIISGRYFLLTGAFFRAVDLKLLKMRII